MKCYFCSILSGNLILKEAEDSRWLNKEQLDSVEWLPADIKVVDYIKEIIQVTINDACNISDMLNKLQVKIIKVFLIIKFQK